MVVKQNKHPQKYGYRTIKAEILRRIGDQTWPSGHLLPSELELAEEFCCARATINRAMRELSDEGIVERKRRAGTRVSASRIRHARFEIPLVRIEIESLGSKYHYALLSRDELRVPVWLRARMNLKPNAKVLHVTCLHFADNRPFQFEDRWINIAAIPSVVEVNFDEISPNEWLVNSVPFSDGEISFAAERAQQNVAELLGIIQDEPVFVAERSTWLNGKQVTLARMCHRSDYRMTTRF